MDVRKLEIMRLSRGEAEFGCFQLAVAEFLLGEARVLADVRALCNEPRPDGEHELAELARAILQRIQTTA